MSFTYGFYNSVNGDRKYNSLQISKIFDGIITDGVYQSIGTRFVIRAYTGGVSNKVEVGIGRAWFDHTWCLNDTAYPLEMPWPDVLLNRYDAIMMDIDSTSKRVNSIIVVEGTLTSSATPVKPIPIRTATHNQYVLAYVLRPANSYPDIADILASEIENTVGTSLCPFVTGILQGMNIDDLVIQWKGQFSELLLKETDLFNTWFNTAKGQLSTDPAGHLQNQINELVDSMAGKEISTFGNFVGGNEWSGFVTAANGKSYGIPYSSASVLELDTGRYEPTDAYTSTFGNLVGPYKYLGGALAPNGKIYCAPYEATNIGVIDPVAKTLTTIGTVAAGAAKYSGAVLAPNGKIYFVPLSATKVLVLDPVTGTTTTFGALGTGNKWAGGVLANNGKIYCIPFTSSTILVINPTNNTTTTIASLAVNEKWYGGVLATNGHIIGVPYAASSILDIDPTNDTVVSGYGAGSMVPLATKYKTGVLAPNGKIYCAPYAARKVLEIDPVTKIVSEIGQDLGAAAEKWSGLIYSKNCIYGCPNSATTILKIKDVMTIGERAKAIDTRVGDPQQLKVINRSSVVAGTNEVIDSNRSGWSMLKSGDLLSVYSVVAPPTYMCSTNNDLTGYISVGMKIQLTQTTVKYFFVAAITPTKITIYGGDTYALAGNEPITNVSYSVVQAPYGFPIASTGLGVDFPIEQGTNANGTYEKRISGTMFCYGLAGVLINAGTQYTSVMVTLPASFANLGYTWTGTQGSAHGVPQLGIATFGQSSTKNLGSFLAHVKTDGTFGSSQYVSLQYIAIGRWK